MANNYGGLVARLILQPVEESSRNYFGSMLAVSEPSRPAKGAIKTAHDGLHRLIHLYMLLAMVVVVVGPFVAPHLLAIVAGSRWIESGAGRVLGNYCYYIPFLAINGISEAFVSSVATRAQLNRQSIWMLAFSVGFGASAYVFLRILSLGADGLVWANVLNMIFRIVWSIAFIADYFRSHGTALELQSLLPRAQGVAVSAAAYILLERLEKHNTDQGLFMTLLKLSIVILPYLLIMWVCPSLFQLHSYANQYRDSATSERHFLLDCYRSVRKPKQT